MLISDSTEVKSRTPLRKCSISVKRWKIQILSDCQIRFRDDDIDVETFSEIVFHNILSKLN